MLCILALRLFITIHDCILTLSRRLTHYCVVKDLDMLDIHSFQKYQKFWRNVSCVDPEQMIVCNLSLKSPVFKGLKLQMVVKNMFYVISTNWIGGMLSILWQCAYCQLVIFYDSCSVSCRIPLENFDFSGVFNIFILRYMSY